MNDILWVQTEPQSTVLVNGMSQKMDIVDYISVADNPHFCLISDNMMKVYFNKPEKCIVVQGHVGDLDSVGRKIAFAFYVREKNIFDVMDILKQRLLSINLTPPSEVINCFLSDYVDQKFIPFLKKKDLYIALFVSFLCLMLLFGISWMMV